MAEQEPLQGSLKTPAMPSPLARDMSSFEGAHNPQEPLLKAPAACRPFQDRGLERQARGFHGANSPGIPCSSRRCRRKQSPRCAAPLLWPDAGRVCHERILRHRQSS